MFFVLCNMICILYLADSWERSLSHQTVVFVFVFVFYVLDTVDGDGDGDGDHLYICQRVRSHSVGAQ